MATIVVGLRPSACVSLVRVVLVGRSLPSATRVIAASKLSTTSRHDCTQSHYHSTTSTGASVTARSPVMQRRLYSLKAARRHLSKEFEARSESKAAAAPALHDNQVRMAPPMSTNVVADQYVPLKSYVNPVAWWGAFRSFMSTRVSLFRMRSTNPTFKPKAWVQEEAIPLWREINSAIANNQLGVIQRTTTDKLCSMLKPEFRANEKRLGNKHVKWFADLTSARFKAARFIQIEQINAKFAQLTVLFDSQQRIEIYDGEKLIGSSKEPKHIIEYWVFERPLSVEAGRWRLCHRFTPEEAESSAANSASGVSS